MAESDLDRYISTHFTPWTIKALRVNGPRVATIGALAAYILERTSEELQKGRWYGPGVINELQAWANTYTTNTND